MNEDFVEDDLVEGGLERVDRSDAAAIADVRGFFGARKEEVFFSRQVEVHLEDKWFHWVTNRAIRYLHAEGEIKRELRPMSTGGTINLMWHRSYRYYKREATRLAELVERYADPNIGGALGLHGEAMILEGFASRRFVMLGRETRTFREAAWSETEHDLDFIFERDGRAYGVEVKNTLGYMDREKMRLKIRMCQELGLVPLFAVRMLPRSWIIELNDVGGFALILKY